MHKDQILDARRFRFTHEPDAKTYGPPDGEWWVYDEAAITALPFAEQASLEEELGGGLSLMVVFQLVRGNGIVGMRAASWLAIRMADRDIAGSFDEYLPRVMLIEWDEVPDGEEPEVADPLASTATPSSPPTA